MRSKNAIWNWRRQRIRFRINRVEMNDTKIGVITSGIPYQYVKEALPDASVLKAGNGESSSEKADRRIRVKSRDAIYCRRTGSGNRRTSKILGDSRRRKRNFYRAGRVQCQHASQSDLKEESGSEKTGSSSGKTADSLSGMSAQKCVPCTEQAENACGRRHRMLYTWSGCAFERNRYDDVYGIKHFDASWNGESKRKRIHKKLGCRNRRFHLFAYRRQFIDEYGI